MANSNRFVSRHGLDNNNNTIQNVADPVNAQDAATKAFSSNAANLASGTVPAARMPAFTGDATVASGTTTITLANSGATAGTYKSVTVDAKGRVTGGTNPTTLSGYGITDAQPLDADLTAIAGLVGTSGILTKTASNAWALDTNTYLTGNQTITATGDVTGSGATSIALTLSNSGVTAGTYKSVTVDAKGRVTSGTNPTTLSGYGITDAQPLDAELTAIAGLSTNGIMVKTGAGSATTRSVAVTGVGLSITNADGTAGNPTITSNATNANTVSTIVARDASGNFSAGTITATLSGNATTATALATARTISVSGDGTGSASFDGSTNAAIALTLANSGVTAGTYKSVTVDAKGRVTGGSNPTTLAGYGITDAVSTSALGVANGVATLDATGLVPTSQLPSYVDDVLEYANLAAFPATGTAGKIFVAIDTAKIYRWSGSAYIEISPTAGNSDTATKLATARSITSTGDASWTVNFDGSANVSAALTLANSGVTAGTYKSVTVDAKGRVTGGTNPTTLAGYGITDAQALDADLTAIAGLAGTSGFLKKTAANTWSLDTASYITGNQTITVSGDASGSGTTAISLTLANSGVTAGTYKSVTVDAKGRVTGGTNPTTLSGYGITDAQPLDAELTAIAGLASNGLVVKTGAGAATTRSVAVSGIGLSISNADGVAGDPTITSNATNVNTASTVVARDAFGNFSAGTITASLSGNATRASSLVTARSITVTGDASWTVSFNGSADASAALTLANSGVTAGTYTKVTVDAKGRVTSGANLASTDVTTALGFTPVNKAGDQLTGFLRTSIATGLTAAGTTQATGLVLSSSVNVVATTAAGTGVVLPAAQPGMTVVVMNLGANSLAVYPASGSAIDALGANAAFSLATPGRVMFIAISATQWYTLNASYA